jgi:hypothetical protein
VSSMDYDPRELEKLASVMSDEALMQQLAEDTDGCLKEQGVDTSKIPPHLVEAVGSLSHGELQALHRVRVAVQQLGESPEGAGGII